MPRIAILVVFALGALFSIGLQSQALDTFEAKTINDNIAESNSTETIALEDGAFEVEDLLVKNKKIVAGNNEQPEQTTTDPVEIGQITTEISESRRSGGGSSNRSNSTENPDANDQSPEVEPVPVDEPTEEPVTLSHPADLNQDGFINQTDLNMLVKTPYGNCADKQAVVGQPYCFGDVNLDGKIDFDDLTALLSAWYDPAPMNPADLNRDGVVGHQDLNMLLKLWLTCTPPEYTHTNDGTPVSGSSKICWGDLDHNGIVDFDDITHMLSNWTEEK